MLQQTFGHLPGADLTVTVHFIYYHFFYFVSNGLLCVLN